ncbi:hypothetical protein SLA2020_215440 [Shorea laevis]
MDEAEKQNDPDVRRLSLIDFSCEDDCLFSSPMIHPMNPKSSEKGGEQKSVWFSEDACSNNVERSADFLEKVGDVREPSESSEPEKGRKSEKYNLRKSLAWDSAFFTSDGVLDSEELSSMIGSGTKKCEKHTLPGIQEDENGSCDSLMTLESDALTLESLEADLFGDIRASIQKSSKASDNANSSIKMESRVAETETVSSSKKAGPASQNKMKLKAAPTKHSVGMQVSGKSLKQNVVRTRESSSSLLKLPKVQSGVTPIPKTSSKKDSIGPKHVKMEKDARSGNVVRAPVLKTPAVGGSRNIIPRTTLHSRSSSYSSVSTKAELTTSCSSLDSCDSASSGSITKSPLNSMKKASNSGTSNNSSLGSSDINPSKVGSRGKIQTGSSQLSALLKSASSPSSSISSASSVSASDSSLSPVSAVHQRSSGARTSIGTGSCKGVSTSEDGAQAIASLGGRVKIASAGTAGLAQPASMKPSGLRMPSPKIGFFDGVRSSGCSPNALLQPSMPSSLPKYGAGTVNPSGSTNRALGFLELVLGPESSNAACLKDTKVAPPNGRHQDYGTDSHSSLKTDIDLHHKTKEKEEADHGALSISHPQGRPCIWPVAYSTFSPTYSEKITGGMKISLAARDSNCNRDGPLDISKVSTVLQADKTATLSISENILPENTGNISTAQQ